MNLIQRFHDFLTRLGISPKVADPFLAGLVAIAISWAITGTFDATELRLLGIDFVYGIFGVAAPAAARVKQKDVVALSHRRRK